MNAFPSCAMCESKPEAYEPNLILTGFMGTGKSSVGRLIAQLCHRPFFDTDKEIERHTQKKIKTIFSEEGEAGFRALECRCVDEWLPDSGAVIATGGGILTSEGMREKLQSRGIVIALFASPETIYARTRNGERPLLKTEDPIGKIRELLALRDRDYRCAGIGVFTDGRTLFDLAQRILRIYRREMERKEE